MSNIDIHNPKLLPVSRTNLEAIVLQVEGVLETGDKQAIGERAEALDDLITQIDLSIESFKDDVDALPAEHAVSEDILKTTAEVRESQEAMVESLRQLREQLEPALA